MKALTVITALFLALFLVPLVGVLFGSFSGWVVGLIFSGTCEYFLQYFKLIEVEMWEIGAFLGFVGSFFRSAVSSK
jgi:hypothetical protein